MKKPVKIFISYAHEDESYKDKLQVNLAVLQRKGWVDAWDDRQLLGGQEWNKIIKAALEKADIILFLVSADFLASSYIFDVEVKLAMEKHTAGMARVIPIIIRPCFWDGTEFANLQAYPKNATPISSWDNEDEAFLDVVTGIEGIINPDEKKESSNQEPKENLAQKKEEFSDLLTEAIDLVAAGDTKMALEKIKTYLDLCGLREDNERVTLSSRQSELRKKVTSGTITAENQETIQDKINKNLLNFIETLQSS